MRKIVSKGGINELCNYLKNIIMAELLMHDVNTIYNLLLKEYGPQGWWPLFNRKTFICEYNPSPLITNDSFFEISIGAILTQNVAWTNVEKALENLLRVKLLSPAKLYSEKNETVGELIKPSGYYNQKTLKLKEFISWFKEYKYSVKNLISMPTDFLRKELLSIKGVGPETADSILLYGLHRKIFLVDAYTKRIFTRFPLFDNKYDYHQIQEFFHVKFNGEIEHYNEYHALIVNHCKLCCKKKQYCENCVLNNNCMGRI